MSQHRILSWCRQGDHQRGGILEKGNLRRNLCFNQTQQQAVFFVTLGVINALAGVLLIIWPVSMRAGKLSKQHDCNSPFIIDLCACACDPAVSSWTTQMSITEIRASSALSSTMGPRSNSRFPFLWMQQVYSSSQAKLWPELCCNPLSLFLNSLDFLQLEMSTKHEHENVLCFWTQMTEYIHVHQHSVQWA